MLRPRILQPARLLLIAALALLAPVARAATVTGTVRNGTSGKPAVGVDVVLIQLQGEMQPVASTKTDAAGKYTLDNPAAARDAMPMLIRAIYRGVNFHQPLPPGQSTADVTIYEPSSDPKTVTLNTRVVMFQPNGADLLVVEEYSLQNDSQPPVALYNPNGDFEFELPAGALNPQVSSWGPSKMPVNQGTINKGQGKFAIAYAFQPGENGVRVTYQLPYPSNQATLKLVSAHSAERIGLIAPASVQIASAGFTPQGQEQGFNFYSRDSIPAGTPFEVSVSGTAPSPSADPGAGQSNAGGGGSASIQVLPNRLDSLKWILLGGFVMLFGLGVFSIWRRPITAGVDVGAPPMPPTASSGRAARKKPAPSPAPPASVAPPPVAVTRAQETAAVVSAVEREVEQGLDGLKDKLFRLELRRQAGTVSEEDYLRERTQAEKVLRELVGR
jgi:hypothetical protein